jgi:hypothetical protein
MSPTESPSPTLASRADFPEDHWKEPDDDDPKPSGIASTAVSDARHSHGPSIRTTSSNPPSIFSNVSRPPLRKAAANNQFVRANAAKAVNNALPFKRIDNTSSSTQKPPPANPPLAQPHPKRAKTVVTIESDDEDSTNTDTTGKFTFEDLEEMKNADYSVCFPHYFPLKWLNICCIETKCAFPDSGPSH